LRQQQRCDAERTAEEIMFSTLHALAEDRLTGFDFGSLSQDETMIQSKVMATLLPNSGNAQERQGREQCKGSSQALLSCAEEDSPTDLPSIRRRSLPGAAFVCPQAASHPCLFSACAEGNVFPTLRLVPKNSN
jgi:hypothetical protein